MTNNDNQEWYWVSQKIFTYQDADTGTQLNVSMDNGISIDPQWGVSYIPSRVNFVFKDSREKSNGKLSVDLQFADLESFLTQVEKMKSDVKQSIASGITTVIHRFYPKNKKDLIAKFTNGGFYKFVIMGTDPTSTVQKTGVSLDFGSASILMKLLKNIRDNYVTLSSNGMVVANQERTVKVLEKMSNTIVQNLATQASTMKGMFGNMMVADATNTDTTDIEPEITTETTKESDTQENFANLFNETAGFDNIELEQHYEGQKTPPKDNIPSPFIGSFLGNNILNLRDWTSSYIGTNSICPFKSILDVSMIPHDEQDDIVGSDKFVEIENLYVEFIRKSIREFMSGDIEDYPKDIPIVMFDTPITSDLTPKTYKMIMEMIITLLVYNILINSSLKYFEGDTEQNNKIGELQRTYFIFKSLLSPFMASINITDDFGDKLVELFEEITLTSALEGLKTEYGVITNGGNIDISIKMFDNVANKFLTVMNSMVVTPTDRVDDVLDKYIPQEVNESEQTYETDSPVGVVEDNSKESLEDLINEQLSEDLRLKLYKDLLKDDGIITVKTYDELDGFLKTASVDDIYYKVKRVMDMNPDERGKNKLRKMIKEFDEDITVTQSRVLQQEGVQSQPTDEAFSTNVFDEF